jgi:poly(3-hydroxybutyrate) depolymerase
MIALFCAFTCALAVAQIPTGPGETKATIGDKDLQVFTYRPKTWNGDGALLMVFHGLNRNADNYRDSAIPICEKLGMVAAAPLFDAARFPTDAYQHGGIVKKKVPQPPESWTYGMIPTLVHEMRRRSGKSQRDCYYIGHSAGGQFLVRLAAFADTRDVRRIVAANPGSHLFPTREMNFPYGFGGLSESLSNDAAIQKYLAAPLTLFLGTADVLPANLDVTETAMKQGPTRIERGRSCFQLAKELAAKNGWTFNWRKVEAEGIGHTASGMFGHVNCALALTGK